MRLKLLLLLLFTLPVLFSCSTQNRLRGPLAPGIKESGPAHPRYSLVFIIHGDDSYLYHDSLGKSRQADENALRQAKEVGQSLQNAEVFIFHLKPKKRFLFFFPRENGDAFYYRDGKLRAQQTYYWAKSASVFGFEGEYYHHFSSRAPATRTLFFYYGHEIPENRPAVYNQSYHRQKFSIPLFTQGLESIYGKPDSSRKPLDLLTLSTCYGGTPGVVEQLAPYTRCLLTSPDNLHLSYIDSEPLIARLNADSTAFGPMVKRYAADAFQRLTERTETMVTVSVYHIAALAPSLDSLAAAYRNRLRQIPELRKTCTDCRKDSALANLLPEKGVTVFYRPPRFGPGKNVKDYSGWGCWRAAESAWQKTLQSRSAR